MGEILQEKYRFIQDDVFLVAYVNVESGKQKLIMQKMNPKTGEVEFSDFIECIHTAIADISFDDYEEIHDNFFLQEEFQEKMLNIRSSEDVVEINLDPEEKFKALKSWIAGIAEAGKDAFKLESDIEMAGFLTSFRIIIAASIAASSSTTLWTLILRMSFNPMFLEPHFGHSNVFANQSLSHSLQCLNFLDII